MLSTATAKLSYYGCVVAGPWMATLSTALA